MIKHIWILLVVAAPVILLVLIQIYFWIKELVNPNRIIITVKDQEVSIQGMELAISKSDLVDEIKKNNLHIHDIVITGNYPDEEHITINASCPYPSNSEIEPILNGYLELLKKYRYG